VLVVLFLALYIQQVKIAIQATAILQVHIQEVERVLESVLQDLSRFFLAEATEILFDNLVDFETITYSSEEHHPAQVVAKGTVDLAQGLAVEYGTDFKVPVIEGDPIQDPTVVFEQLRTSQIRKDEQYVVSGIFAVFANVLLLPIHNLCQHIVVLVRFFKDLVVRYLAPLHLGIYAPRRREDVDLIEEVTVELVLGIALLAVTWLRVPPKHTQYHVRFARSFRSYEQSGERGLGQVWVQLLRRLELVVERLDSQYVVLLLGDAQHSSSILLFDVAFLLTRNV
jgi:hypothetical protein